MTTLIQHNVNMVPTVIDDDVQRTSEAILRTESEDGEPAFKLDPENKRKLLEAICVAMQTERNGWKDRLQSTLHEIDRQHKAAIGVERSLQDLVVTLGIKSEPSTNGRYSADIISTLHNYIKNLQEKANRIPDDSGVQEHINNLRDEAKRLEQEKHEFSNELQEKAKQVAWLEKELVTVKEKLTRTRQIILNYNQSHSSNFHLEEESTTDVGRSRSDPQMSRERTYVEGDQVNYFSTTGEEIAVWKLRHRQTREAGGVGGLLGGSCHGGSSYRGSVAGGIGGGSGGGGGKAVTQCLRCNQFFKGPDNNTRACRYHKKGRQIREQYDPSGRLLRVLYTWACCKKGLDAPGCTYGCHI